MDVQGDVMGIRDLFRTFSIVTLYIYIVSGQSGLLVPYESYSRARIGPRQMPFNP